MILAIYNLIIKINLKNKFKKLTNFDEIIIIFLLILIDF